ncbi:MAG: GGDEF domain-containing protein [Treponema sp.]|jgi:diguanylate cyclase (GGDEF)-like protein|nr:GGDEF domain-containing protein [Treponema sp.]
MHNLYSFKNYIEKNTIYLFLALFCVLHLFYAVLLFSAQTELFRQPVIWNAVLSFIYLILFLFRTRMSRIIVYTVIVTGTLLYTLAFTLYTELNPGFIFILLAFIPVTFLFLDGIAKPSHYNLIIYLVVASTIFVETLLTAGRTPDIYRISLKTRQICQTYFFSNVIFVFAEIIFALWNMANKLYKINRESEMTYKEVEYIAKHDVLTGLINRRRIADILRSCEVKKKADGTDYAICIFDIDEFKHINDTYGHDAGDCILKEFTRAIRDRIPLPAKIGRWGGEEFLILYPFLTDNTIFELDNVRKEASECIFDYRGTGIRVSATFGISSSRHLKNHEEVLTDADHQLYEGKTHGKNRLVVSGKF